MAKKRGNRVYVNSFIQKLHGECVASGVGNYQQSNTKQNGELITQAVSNEQIFNIWNNPQKRILGKY